MHICFTKKSIVVFLIWLTAIIILLVLEFQHDPSKVITQPDLQKIREANNLEHLNHVEVAMIFRHGSKNGRLQHNFKNAVTSLLKHSSQPVHLTLVCERPSYFVALRILSDVAYENPDIVPYEVFNVSSENLILDSETQEAMDHLVKIFSSGSNSYYSDPLFFFNFFVYEMLSFKDKVILLDIDIRVDADIVELNKHFSNFTADQVVGMAPELSPVYYASLSSYSELHNDTKLGRLASEGGFPGINSGVLLVDIPRLRDSNIIKSYMNVTFVKERLKYYRFKGNLGDQDLYNLIAFDHPEIFYILPCNWNRQLCSYYNGHGYADVFPLYHQCEGPIKIYHGNCKSKIPPIE